MKKVILIGLGVVAAIVGVVLIVAAFQPSEFRVERSAVIPAPPAVVFEQVNDLHNWDGWSPWAKLDPNSKVNFEGPRAGKDAAFRWDGNSDVGTGKMTITESAPGERVSFRLEFKKPYEGTNTAEFTFKPEGDGTRVTWSMSGRNNFVGRVCCMVMNMDKMLGGEFEKGLANMKAVVEKTKG